MKSEHTIFTNKKLKIARLKIVPTRKLTYLSDGGVVIALPQVITRTIYIADVMSYRGVK